MAEKKKREPETVYTAPEPAGNHLLKAASKRASELMQSADEAVFRPAREKKAELQAAVDRRSQNVANRFAGMGRKLDAAGYPRAGAAVADVGAGAAALGSTVAEQALETIPESPADAAMAVGPGRLLKGAGKARNIIARSVGKADEAQDVARGLRKLGDLSGETSNAAMSQMREALRKQGFNEEEIRTKLRKLNEAAQAKK